jgi:hypothetical protein
VFENKMPRRIFGTKREGDNTGEKCIMVSVITRTLPQTSNEDFVHGTEDKHELTRVDWKIILK